MSFRIENARIEERTVPLYVVQHTHEAATCPAGDEEVAPQLLQVLAAAPQAGVTILAEAIVDGQHELNIIASSENAPTPLKLSVNSTSFVMLTSLASGFFLV